MGRLAEQFVCVRVQSMNGVNINLFQFERDLTWMAFFMDANDQFYARYGGREDEHAESHLNKESLQRVMKQVLELQRDRQVQTGRFEPSGKPLRTPEDIPPMQQMIARRKENKCIHCHDVKVAELRHQQSLDRFTRDMVFTYPTPSSVGIRIDPRQQNRVEAVLPDSAATKAGVLPGDVILSADGQRTLTLADFARVLELTPKEAKLPLQIRRGEQTLTTTLELAGNWRRGKDPSWRESLHVAGPNAGFWGQKLNEEERRRLGVAADTLAVRVTFVWGDFTRQAGLRIDDVVIEFDDLRRDMTINQLHAHLNLNRNYSDKIPLVVLRDGKRQELSVQLPSHAPDP